MSQNIENQNSQNVDLTKLKIDVLLKKRSAFKILLVAVVFVTLIACIGTFFINIADKNSYDITVSGTNGNLSLSFDPEFKTGYSVIKAKGADKMESGDGGTYSEIQDYIDGVITGEIGMEVTKNGQQGKAQRGSSDEYSVVKLYLKNQSMSGEDINYKLKIEIYDNKRNAFSAARIMVAMGSGDNVKKQVYAQPDEFGVSELVATQFRGSENYVKDENGVNWRCKNFKKDEFNNWFYDSQLLDNTIYSLKPGQVEPIVVAVWFEGSDKDHGDDIVGGSYSLKVSFETI